MRFEIAAGPRHSRHNENEPVTAARKLVIGGTRPCGQRRNNERNGAFL